jgi:hypothetical protein
VRELAPVFRAIIHRLPSITTVTGAMILAVLSLPLAWRREPLSEASTVALQQTGLRARSFARAQGQRRHRRRVIDSVGTWAWLSFGLFLLGWNPAGMLAFLLFNAMVSVAQDVIRVLLYPKLLSASHAREVRALEALTVAEAVRAGRSDRPARRPVPQVWATLAAAFGAALVAVPLVLHVAEWQGWGNPLHNPLLPFLMLVSAGGRTLALAYEQFKVSRKLPGVDVVFVRSDDALDIFVLAAVLSLLALPLGAEGAWLPVLGILVARTAFWAHRAWWTERAARRVKGVLVHLGGDGADAAATTADADDEEGPYVEASR